MACVEFTVNGAKCVVTECIPRETSLSAYIRYRLGLPGTKAMCHEGGCGACIVNVCARTPTTGNIETFSVNSCMVLVFSCNGWDITTIEGVGNRKDGYSDVQKRLHKFNGTQCGFCSPGWVMQMTSLQDKHLTMAELEVSFGSNTCRCTGFRPILDTMKSFAVDASPELCKRVKDIEDIKICSKTNKICQRKCSVKSIESDWSLLNDLKVQDNRVISFDFGDTKYYKVYEEDDIFDILRRDGVDSYMLVDGNTGKGVYENYEYPKIMIDISSVASLKKYMFDQNLILGANISLEDCIKIFEETVKTRSEFWYLTEFVKHFKLIAHIPVRKIGSLAGNLMLKHEMPSYQSDVFLLLECVGAMLTVRHTGVERAQLLLPDFLKYDMQEAIIVNIELPPLNPESHVFRSYKVMPRNQNALAIVNAAFLLKWDCSYNIERASLVFGNIAPDFIHAARTENYLVGKNVFNNNILQGAIQQLNIEISPVDKPPEESPECRKKLAIGLFYKFVLNISPPGIVAPNLRSGGNMLHRPVSKGIQDFQTDPTLYPLNQPIDKLEGLLQCAGETEYANDTPNMMYQVFASFVLSDISTGEIDHIDDTEVMKIKGVLAVLTAKDIPGKNSFIYPGVQLETEDEEIVASKNIKFYGQPVAILVAESQGLAAMASKKVVVTYKHVNSQPPLITINEAKKNPKRYIPGGSDASITPKGRGADVKKIVKGFYELEAQYHYYLEPITCFIKPVEKGVEVYDSTQWIDLTQIAIATCLGINESDVLVKVRRIGGGFGGKISRNVQAATACAVVAKTLNVPCRFIMPMTTNMAIAGARLPNQCNYQVEVDENGKIQYLDAILEEDEGCSHNENILSYTVGGFKNCYNTDYFNLKTASVLTDLPSNTFARAPGTFEGMSTIEHIMEHIAFEVNKDPTEVRKANMRVEDNDLPMLIEELKIKSDYDKRLKEIQQYNEANRWTKKSIKIAIMSFPVEYYGNYSAFVSIYRGDGTVTVSGGGIEMGQGINTKVAQVCASELRIPLEYVSIIPSYSFVSPNNVFSGSSITSESVCYATLKACRQLNVRLEPIRLKMTDAAWKDIVFAAAAEEIDLTEKYMMTDKEPDLENYSAFAVAIMETELDVLTGRYQILRADILEDVGLSANPNIDVGQVEGGFVQGLGCFTSEKMVRDKTTGKLLTNRSLTYHVPLARDIPIEFNIYFRYNSRNIKGVLGSKTVGEMGVCTAHVITFVLRECIMESRKDSGYPKEWIFIQIPYNTESILKALDVKLEEMVLNTSD